MQCAVVSPLGPEAVSDGADGAVVVTDELGGAPGPPPPPGLPPGLPPPPEPPPPGDPPPPTFVVRDVEVVEELSGVVGEVTLDEVDESAATSSVVPGPLVSSVTAASAAVVSTPRTTLGVRVVLGLASTLLTVLSDPQAPATRADPARVRASPTRRARRTRRGFIP
jgi:hypothetical protein